MKISKGVPMLRKYQKSSSIEKISKWVLIEKISKSFQYGENVEELLILRKNFKGSEY